jgi:hypothetical protein
MLALLSPLVVLLLLIQAIARLGSRLRGRLLLLIICQCSFQSFQANYGTTS